MPKYFCNIPLYFVLILQSLVCIKRASGACFLKSLGSTIVRKMKLATSACSYGVSYSMAVPLKGSSLFPSEIRIPYSNTDRVRRRTRSNFNLSRLAVLQIEPSMPFQALSLACGAISGHRWVHPELLFVMCEIGFSSPAPCLAPEPIRLRSTRCSSKTPFKTCQDVWKIFQIRWFETFSLIRCASFTHRCIEFSRVVTDTD